MHQGGDSGRTGDEGDQGHRTENLEELCHPSMLRPEVPHGLEIVAAEGLKGDERAGIGDPGERRDVAGHHVGQLLVPADPKDRHQVGFAGDGVHLGNARDVGQLAGQIGDARRFGIDQDKGVHHEQHARPQLVAPARSAGSRVAGVASPRYRCAACGNVTRFDVTMTRRTRSFYHFTVGGDLTVEDEQVLSESVEQISCRWCGSGYAVETVSGEPESSEV